MFKIEKNIPIVTQYRSKYPFGKMEIGDSFVFPGDVGIVRSSAFSYGKLHNKKFKTRMIDGGVRIWRVE